MGSCLENTHLHIDLDGYHKCLTGSESIGSIITTFIECSPPHKRLGFRICVSLRDDPSLPNAPVWKARAHSADSFRAGNSG
jgi:hypothetical protein